MRLEAPTDSIATGEKCELSREAEDQRRNEAAVLQPDGPAIDPAL
jgi:hypothetical protein